MASTGAEFLSGAGVFSPGVGWMVSVGAAVFDATVIMPALQGKGRQAAKAPRLLDSPIGSNEPGAPRIWAIGMRVRVPTHVIWQSTKVRDTNVTLTKGQSTPQRRVYVDALIALNDRPTTKLVQLAGNGKLLLYRTRNLIEVRSSEMAVTVDGTRLVLTMGSTADPDFTHKFDAGDAVELRGFIVTAGVDVNSGYWKVAEVAAHTSEPSSIELEPYSGQSAVGVVATAGTPFSPAYITRVDDRIFNEDGAYLPFDTALGAPVNYIVVPVDSHLDPEHVFDASVLVRVVGLSLPGYGSLQPVQFRIDMVRSNAERLILNAVGVLFPNITGFPILLTGASATNAAYVEYETQPQFTTGVFPPTYNPDDFFHDGSETQGEDTLLAEDQGTGNIPAYRGMAYQGLEKFFVQQFGDSMPYSLEAVIDVDRAMTVGDGLREILVQRCDVPPLAVDTSGVTVRPLLGYYLRGSVPAITSLQPLLVAYQVVGQERDGVIALFDIEAADQVQIQNGAQYTHFGCRTESSQPTDEKWSIEDMALEDMPTSIGVRHQDPDNGFADGYQSFGLRNPFGVDFQNEAEMDLSSLVLSRKQAAEVAETGLRRAHVNRRTYRFALPCAYLHVLENDLLTWTDDDGVDHTARVVTREIDAAFRVLITAVAEDAQLIVTGSAVQSAAGTIPERIDGPAAVEAVVVDCPAIAQAETERAGIKLAVHSAGGHWTGASLWESFDNQAWQFVTTIGEQAAVGTLTEALPAADASESYGTTTVSVREETVEAQFTAHGVARIDSATEAEAIAGKNWCALIDADGAVEVAAFTTVTDSGDNILALGGWLRGLRGTSPIEHVAGARIVMLTPEGGGVVHREFPGEVTPAELWFKVVPAGQTIDDVEAIEVSAEWRNARPLPVRAISRTDNAVGIRIKVDAHWCKAVLPLGTQPPHPMDDAPEGYRFTIYDVTGAVVIRRIDLQANPVTGSPSLRDKWIDYTFEEMEEDGIVIDAPLWVDVQQISRFGLGPSIKQAL
jgi:hypothetical protein